MRQHFVTGLIGETEVALHYMRQGWEVYWPFSGSSSLDMICTKGRRVKRVQVKTSGTKRNGSWMVSVRGLDRTLNDVLVVYLTKENRVVEIKMKDVPLRKRQIRIPCN